MATHRSYLLALALALSTACGASTPTVLMASSPEVPAAQGTIKATRTETNDNTRLEVNVQHLALPGRVEPGATTYVVWAREPGRDTFQNLGALRVGRDLTGTLKTVTPLRTFDVLITAERSPTVTTPTSKSVLVANVEAKRG